MISFREITVDMAETLELGAHEIKRELAEKGMYESLYSHYLDLDAFIRRPGFASKKVSELVSIFSILAICSICAMKSMVRKDASYKILADEIASFYDENEEYGEEFIKNYSESGALKYVQPRVYDKLIQLQRLLKKENPNQQFIEFTLRDLASYCIMTLMALDKSRKIYPKTVDESKM